MTNAKVTRGSSMTKRLKSTDLDKVLMFSAHFATIPWQKVTFQFRST